MKVPMDDDEVRGLLGAYALDALDAPEVAAVEALLGRDEHAAAEADRLRDAAAWIGATEAMAPPHEVRSDLLRTLAVHADERKAYGAETRRFDALLATIPSDALDVATWNGLTIGGLVAHMAAMETAVAEGLGAPAAFEAPSEIEARTDVFIRACEGAPELARRHWLGAVATVSDWADAGGQTGSFPWWGLEASRRTLLTARAFEHWTHGDDIRRALGRPLEAPSEGTLRVMSDVAVGLLPGGLAANGLDAQGRVARIVLTGAGGGDWTVALGTGDEPSAGSSPDVTVTADVVDFCRRVGDRVRADELACTVDGDRVLATELLEAASAFATL